MKIAIDAHFLSKISQGTGTYTYQLLESLKEFVKEEDVIYLLNKEDVSSYFNCSHYEWKRLSSNNTPVNILYGFLKIMNNIDIIHTNYLCPIFSIRKTKRIVTVHDILFKTHGEFFPKRLSTGVNLFTKTCLLRADKIISVSNYTKKELVRYYPFVKNKCEVIYEAPSKEFKVLSDIKDFEIKWNISKPYILFVGRFAPIKNIEKLIDIYTGDNTINAKYDLVLVGKFDKSFPNVKLQSILETGTQIKVFSSISNDDLNILYNKATMLYFVSHGEGFGLPILEAMAAGCPVLTSNTTACREISSDAALQVNPNSVDEIYRKMKMLLSDKKMNEDYKYRGIEHSMLFSWKKCASQTYDLYQSVVK